MIAIIRNIDAVLKTQFCVRAAFNGRSMEDETRDILRSALSTDISRSTSVGPTIHERFAALRGVDLPDVPREPGREPVRLDE